ncbi:type II toxin-antitoxin system VapC family toxin [Anatilimnocola sp. NA78]|uniref:type II toxin-antitoxin system VapC family toxin n=1 Tax=Anatilimnocola sp. NA78 TaxID=3415683 RepID=UPI003CE53A3D
MKTIYIETSIISFLRARASSHIVSAARQLLTQRWWNEERHRYQLLTSQYVIDEAAQGNAKLANERLAIIGEIQLLEISDAIPALAEKLMATAVLPPSALVDALHICAASYHRLDYLLTWNCTHIANARILPQIRRILLDSGFELPTVCTPEEMVDEQANTD